MNRSSWFLWDHGNQPHPGGINSSNRGDTKYQYGFKINPFIHRALNATNQSCWTHDEQWISRGQYRIDAHHINQDRNGKDRTTTTDQSQRYSNECREYVNDYFHVCDWCANMAFDDREDGDYCYIEQLEIWKKKKIYAWEDWLYVTKNINDCSFTGSIIEHG